MTDNEMLDAMRDLLKPINNKLEELSLKIDGTDLKIESLRLENKTEHRAMRKDIEKLNDEMETIIEVLKGKNILPIAK